MLVLAGGVVAAIALLNPPLASATPATTAEDFPNPERGWFDSVDLTDPSTIQSADRDGVTVVRTFLRLDAFRDAPISQEELDALDRGFATLRADHLKIVVRVTYNADQAGADTSLARIQEHAAQLKPLMAKNVDVILSFEAGFIGTWGEWHSSTNGLDTEEAKAAVLKAVLAAFPRSRDVALRYPDDIRTLLPKQVTEASAYGGSAQARVGNHEDCFLSSDPDDGGTWGQNGGSVEKDKALIASLGRFTIVGGETCGTSSRTTCGTATSELAMLHFTYLNRQFDATALEKLRDEGCGGEIDRRLGYRLAVTRVGWSDHVDPGGDLRLELDIRNDGFAHVVNRRPVYLVLTKGSEVVPVRLHLDPRRWAAGATTSVHDTVTLPAAVTKGSWRLSLWLPDAAQDLRADSAYSIRLANDGTWDAATGRNALPATVRVE